MLFQKTTLNNGLRIITVPMPSMESAAVEVFVGAGTRDEKKEVNGLAHFLEHMVFKGTKKYPSAHAISSAVDAIGAEINAHTGKEATAFYIKAWEKHLGLAFDILSEFIKHPLLKKEEIEREKGVIKEEIAMYEDLPMRKAPSVFEELLYGPSSLGWEILGSRETVSNIGRDDFVDFRRRFYSPRNMILTVAGRFDKGRVLGMAKEAFGELRDKANKDSDNSNNNKDNNERNSSGKPELKVVNKKTEQAHIVLGVRGNPLGHPDRYKETVLSTVLGGGMSSRLWTQIRERRGLAYYVQTYIDHYTDNGYLATRAGVKLDKVEEAVKVTLEEYQKTKKLKNISKAELEKAKEYLKGKLALGLEDTHAVAEFFGEQELFEKEVKTPEEIMSEIDRVTVEGVLEVASKFFQKNRLNLAIVGPFEDSSRFGKLLKL
ncbi:MAG: insulinase family protein [Candidatus Blackburnbacteria bacterium]|nr:insulinase family protein [Candidatus Blackburnbacteria bacterium]